MLTPSPHPPVVLVHSQVYSIWPSRGNFCRTSNSEQVNSSLHSNVERPLKSAANALTWIEEIYALRNLNIWGKDTSRRSTCLLRPRPLNLERDKFSMVLTQPARLTDTTVTRRTFSLLHLNHDRTRGSLHGQQTTIRSLPPKIRGITEVQRRIQHGMIRTIPTSQSLDWPPMVRHKQPHFTHHAC